MPVNETIVSSPGHRSNPHDQYLSCSTRTKTDRRDNGGWESPYLTSEAEYGSCIQKMQ